VILEQISSYHVIPFFGGGPKKVPHKNGLEPEPLNGVIFTLPTNKLLNISRIDNSCKEKKFLAMWSFVHWQGDTSILDAHLLILALEIGTS
jgi:hypothetical protein